MSLESNIGVAASEDKRLKKQSFGTHVPVKALCILYNKYLHYNYNLKYVLQASDSLLILNFFILF